MGMPIISYISLTWFHSLIQIWLVLGIVCLFNYLLVTQLVLAIFRAKCHIGDEMDHMPIRGNNCSVPSLLYPGIPTLWGGGAFKV